MINISSVEMKTTTTGKEYKKLVLDDGSSVNMWLDDPDYNEAVAGASLDRTTEQNGKFTNLVQKGSTGSKPSVHNGDISTKLSVIYEILLKIGDKVGVEMSEKKAIINENNDVIPEEIPF